MKKKQIPGLMLAMVQKDTVLFAGGIGQANLATGEKVTNRHIFRLGSITKSFTALAILQLSREGRFRLDQPLREIAPEIDFENPWEQSDPVRLIHLLEHTAGFDDMRLGTVYIAGDKPLEAFEAVERHKKSMISRWKPGLCSSYSNPGYAILGYLVEKYSGMPYEEYVKTKILHPIGLDQAHFSERDLFDSLPHAHGYVVNPKKVLEDKGFPQIVGNGAGALCASAQDMAAWLLYLTSHGKGSKLPLLDSAILSESRHSHSTLASFLGHQVGYGYGIYKGFLKTPVPFYGHSGGIDGFISYYGFVPSLGVGFALSANAMSSIQELTQIVAAYLTTGVEAEFFEPKAISETQRRKWSEVQGYFALFNHRQAFSAPVAYLFNGVHASWKGDTLLIESFLEPAEYYLHQGQGAFRKPGQNSASAFILFQDNETPYLLVEDSIFKPSSGTQARFWLILWISAAVIAMVMVFMGLVWTIMVLTKGLTFRRYLVRMLPVGSVLAMLFVVFAIALLASNPASVTERTFTSLLIPVGTVLFMALSHLGLFIPFLHNFQEPSKWVRVVVLVSSAHFTLLSWYLFHFGLIGTQFW
jgi:CubicO group peptidase (beta-lactamase class C family)